MVGLGLSKWTSSGVAELPNLALIQCADLVVLLRLTSRLWRATAVMLIRAVSRKHVRYAPAGHHLSPQQTLSRMKRAIQMRLLEEQHCRDWQIQIFVLVMIL